MKARIAIIGAGHMGRYHALATAALRDRGGDATLSGVADIDATAARRLAEEAGCPAADARALFGVSDAVIVAVPTTEHFGLARSALLAGCDVLVEKPIAATASEAEALLALARRTARVLRVGSQEWHNPAFRALHPKIESPHLVLGHRVGPFSERGGDVDVVRDRMIHDLDLLQKLLGEEPVAIEATGVRVVSGAVDVANARLRFSGGCVASLTASRVSLVSSRKIQFFQPGAHCEVDFLEPSAAIYRRVEPIGGDVIEREALAVGGDDALCEQLREFVQAIRQRDTSPDSGAAALAALRTAARIVAAMPAGREPS